LLADAELVSAVGAILARLDRHEALLVRLQPADHPSLIQALAEATADTDGGWFVSGRVVRLARNEAIGAAAEGRAEPALSVALRLEGIDSAHLLGKWLGLRPDVERGGEERAGVQWRVRGFDPAKPPSP